LSGVEMISLLFIRHFDDLSSSKERERVENVCCQVRSTELFVSVSMSGSGSVTVTEILTVDYERMPHIL
jgi:hypothetical protein